MYELKKKGTVFTSKFVGTGPSSYEKKKITGLRSHKGWETLYYTTTMKGQDAGYLQKASTRFYKGGQV